MDNKLFVLDATLRDGGLVNNFNFSDDFVKALYKANIEAGIDYMEFGYRSDRKLFDDSQYGKWKYSSDEDIRAIVGENHSKLKISVMVDVGRCDYKEDIRPKKDSPIDMFRIATYIDTLPEAIEMINYISNLGYETTCNIMAISKCSIDQIENALKLLCHTPVLAIYVVDSFGALYPKQTRDITILYTKILSQAEKAVGIHSHNNQQCAFANTLEAKENGATWMDCTAYGMGRGAGNCNSEAILGVLNGDKYHIEPLLDFISKWMIPMKNSGIEWGYNTSYMLTGIANKHPSTAISATQKKDSNYTKQFKLLS